MYGRKCCLSFFLVTFFLLDQGGRGSYIVYRSRVRGKTWVSMRRTCSSLYTFWTIRVLADDDGQARGECPVYSQALSRVRWINPNVFCRTVKKRSSIKRFHFFFPFGTFGPWIAIFGKHTDSWRVRQEQMKTFHHTCKKRASNIWQRVVNTGHPFLFNIIYLGKCSIVSL